VVWLGAEEGEYFRSELVSRQRKRIEAVPCRHVGAVPTEHRATGAQCKIVYDKFHIMQHANDAIGEVRKAEFGKVPRSGV